MMAAADASLSGPLSRSVRTAFRALYAVIVVLALGWAASNIRQVPADSRAVVLRFGRLERAQDAGLLLAWPQPIEQVVMLPARDRQTELKLQAPGASLGPSSETDFTIHQPDDVIQLRGQKDAWNGSYFLTGDSGVVEFDATLFYRIVNTSAYYLAQPHVAPALQRLYAASAVAVTASRDIDDFLVARPEQSGQASAEVAARREALRGDLVDAINARLADLRRNGTDLGIEVSRIDVVALLPPLAKSAFDDVLTAAQMADQTAAAARTDAARIAQQADRDHDQVITEAEAAADERVRTARADTVAIEAIEYRLTPQTRDSLLADYYRERIGAIMAKVGTVTGVSATDGQRIVLPGPPP